MFFTDETRVCISSDEIVRVFEEMERDFLKKA